MDCKDGYPEVCPSQGYPSARDSKLSKPTSAFSLVFFFFPFSGRTHSIWKFLGQGMNLSLSCDSSKKASNKDQLEDLWEEQRAGIQERKVM